MDNLTLHEKIYVYVVKLCEALKNPKVKQLYSLNKKNYMNYMKKVYSQLYKLYEPLFYRIVNSLEENIITLYNDSEPVTIDINKFTDEDLNELNNILNDTDIEKLEIRYKPLFERINELPTEQKSNIINTFKKETEKFKTDWQDYLNKIALHPTYQCYIIKDLYDYITTDEMEELKVKDKWKYFTNIKNNYSEFAEYYLAELYKIIDIDNISKLSRNELNIMLKIHKNQYFIKNNIPYSILDDECNDYDYMHHIKKNIKRLWNDVKSIDMSALRSLNSLRYRDKLMNKYKLMNDLYSNVFNKIINMDNDEPFTQTDYNRMEWMLNIKNDILLGRKNFDEENKRYGEEQHRKYVEPVITKK